MNRVWTRWAFSAVLPALLAAPTVSAMAGDANILAVDVTQLDETTFRIAATVEHGDTGWDHYADRFDVLAPDGTVLAERVLLHPHVEEQPFTRSVTATIPQGVSTIIVRAHDSVHALGGATLEVRLER